MGSGSSQSKILLLTLFGVLLFVLVFMFVFTPLQEQAANLQSEITVAQSDLLLLQEHEANLPTYEKQTEANRVYVAEQIKQYPYDVLEEDSIVWLLDFEESNTVNIETLSFSENVPFLQFSGIGTVDGVEQIVDMQAYSTTLAFSGEFSYDQIKQAINYIYDTPHATAVDSVTVSYDATTAKLLSNFTLSKYLVQYPGGVYVPLQMPQVPIGVDALFGTTDGVSEEVDEQQEEEG